MSKLKHDVLLRLVKTLDILLVTGAFAVCWYTYYASRIVEPFYKRGNWLIILLFLVLYMLFGRIYDGFLISYQRISEIVYSQALAVCESDFLIYIVIVLLSKHVVNLIPGILCLLAQLIIIVGWGYCAHKWYFRTFRAKKTAVVYDARTDVENLINAYGLAKKFDVQLTVSADECLETPDMLQGMEVVFFSGVHSHDRNIILKYCIQNNIDMFLLPRIGDIVMSGAKPMHMFHLPMMRVGRYMASPEYLLIKRALDILISALALIILSPLMLITAIAIKANDGGPVFYKQVRLTKDGKEFNMLKFRSMRVDAEKEGIALLSTGVKDNRITKVGRVIRACRIDELPQLINIIRGDLSIVGPRPERPEIAAQYCEHIPEFSLRLQAKGGLTGYAQVYGKYNTTPYDKLQMDLMYIAHPSIWEDIRICFATIKILFMPESTEGFDAGNAMAHTAENDDSAE